MTHVLRYAARTDRGLLRSNNQDSVFAGDRLLVIADGMGGHAAGDVASRLVVAAFVDLDELPLGSDMVRPLTDATREGNSAIAEMVDDNPELDGMGTTLTALLFDGPLVALAHVGDSRAYLYRNGVLHQISHDDTFVQSLVDDGRITADEAAHHPQRSLLLRALNGTDMDPSITLRETSPGDRFLICSDGLSDVVSPEAIADALAGPDPDQVADTLIQLALVGGGPDNVTVIVADVVDTGGSSGFGIGGGIDPEATGPMQPIHLTQKMPRIPLPPIPEDPPAKAEYAPADGDGPEDDVEDDPDDGYDNGYDDADPAAPEPAGGGAVPAGPGTGRAVSGPPPPRWHRRWALALAVAVLVGVGLTGSYMWTTTKYYVGDHDDQVTVFRGVNGSVLGLRLASAQENSCAAAARSGCSPLKVKDLVQAARDQVSAGIPVGTLADARAVVTRLTSQQLPPCPPAGAPITGVATSSTTSRAAQTAPTAQKSSATSRGATATATTPRSTTPRTTAKATRTTTARTTTARTTTARTTMGRTTAPVRTTPALTTAPPPTPVTTTVTVTVPAQAAASAPASSGQRLRADAPVSPRTTVAAAATSRSASRPVPPASVTTAGSAPSTPAAVSPRTTAPGPITRPRAPVAAPTVTVFTTVTSTPSTVPPSSSATSSATPLVSPAAQPGVTCRVVS